MINWQLSKQGIVDQYHLSVSRAQVSTHRSQVFFFDVICWQVTSFQMIAGSSLICFKFIWNTLCLCAAQLRFWFQTDLGRKNSATYYRQERQLLLTLLTMVTLYFQLLCSDWSKFDRWVHAESLCSILNLVHFDSWSWQNFESTCDVFNCLFPLDAQNEIQLLSGVFLYSWLIGFWLRNTSLVKVGNLILDGIVFVFHLAWCVIVEKSEAILASLDTFQELHLEWQAWVIIVFDVCFLHLI